MKLEAKGGFQATKKQPKYAPALQHRGIAWDKLPIEEHTKARSAGDLHIFAS